MSSVHSNDISINNININKNEIMMKIAIPTRENAVDNHFGHCEYYTILTVGQDNQILSSETIPSPQGCGCKSNIAGELENMESASCWQGIWARCFECTYSPSY